LLNIDSLSILWAARDIVNATQSTVDFIQIIFCSLGCVEDTSGNNSIVFASKSLILKALEMEVTEMHVDATFRVIPSTPKSYQLLIMHVMVNNHVSYNNNSKYAKL